jgi:hypothetical protein
LQHKISANWVCSAKSSNSIDCIPTAKSAPPTDRPAFAGFRTSNR